MAMNTRIRSLWVRALRGGNYKQARYRLRRADNSCCCLGVLCDLVDPTGWSNNHPSGRYRYLGDHGNPDNSVLNAAGLSYNQSCKLAEMNDFGKSFDEIADYIEANL